MRARRHSRAWYSPRGSGVRRATAMDALSQRESAAALHVGRLEAANGVRLVVVRLEHRQQLGDGQEVRDALRQAEQLQASALAADRREGPDNLSQAGAVDVGDVGEVQDELLVALQHQTVDLVLEDFVTLAEGHLSLQVQDGNVAGGSFLDLHRSSNELRPVKAGILAQTRRGARPAGLAPWKNSLSVSDLKSSEEG